MFVSPSDYQRNYNLNIINNVRQDYQGNDYISWSYAFHLLNTYHPSLRCELVGTRLDGTILQIALTDGVNYSSTLHYPLMDSKNKSLADVESRDFSDGYLRGCVKAIAIETGIGFRLFTRELIDIKPKVTHPFVDLLKQYNNALAVVVDSGLDYTVKDIDFGTSVHELKEYIQYLKHRASQRPVYEVWGSVQEAIDFVVGTLNITEAEATKMYEETKPDASGSRRKPLYDKVQTLARQAAR